MFENFLYEFARSIGKTKIQVTTLPKQTEAGNPDFRIWDGKQNIVGYIEAKKPGENLDVIENSPQLKRYRKTFPNLILTDFYEFRLYRNGEMVYKIEVPETIPEFYLKIYERAVKNNKDIRIVKLAGRRQIKSYITPVLSLVNETFRDVYAFVPLEEREMREFAQRYLMILDKRFIKIIENGKGEVIAFILGIPDISEGIKKSRGYVLPFGIFQIIRSQHRSELLSLLLGGIREDYRNSGLDTILGVQMLKEVMESGLKFIDSHLELETNYKMRAEMEKMGGIVYKKYRIYQKAL